MVRLRRATSAQGEPSLGLPAAVQFLTRIPIRLGRPPPMGRVAPWFPVAGALIGAAVGGAAAGLWHLVPPLVAAAVAVASGLLITGAFHEDGLADVADAFGGGWTVERRLEILRDPHHGSYGVASMCASIVIRIVALGSLPGPATMFAAAVAAHALARSAALGSMTFVRNAKPSGLGFEYGRSLSPLAALAGLAGGIAIAAAVTGWWVGPLVVACAAGALAVALLAMRKIGGVGGDVLGATEQVAECLVLIVVSGLAAHFSLWWR